MPILRDDINDSNENNENNSNNRDKRNMKGNLYIKFNIEFPKVLS